MFVGRNTLKKGVLYQEKVTQYTRLYVDGEEIKGIKSIKALIGKKPRQLWQIHIN